MLRPPGALAASPSLGRRIGSDETLFHRIGENQMRQRPPRPQAGLRVPCGAFCLLQYRDSLLGNGGELMRLERRQALALVNGLKENGAVAV